MLVVIKKVWERNETQGKSRDGSTFPSSRQGLEGEVNGQKIRITAFGCPDLSGFANTTVDILKYKEQPAYNGVPQYQINNSSTITPVNKPQQPPQQFSNNMFDGNDSYNAPQAQGSTQTQQSNTKQDDQIDARIGRFMEIYAKVNIQATNKGLSLTEENRVKIALTMLTGEQKR